MGTVAVTNIRPLGQMPQIRGKAILCTITMSSSYATGGDTLPMTSLPFNDRVQFFAPVSKFESGVRVRGEAMLANGGGAAFKAAGTPTVPLIQSFVGDATPTQTANATNLSTVAFDAIIVGV